MPPTVAAQADSATATEEWNGDPSQGFAEFQTEQRNQSVQHVEAPAEEHAPDSDRVDGAGDEPAKGKQEPLTDEQKSAMKRANNEKRWEKLLRERDDAKAELERLKTQKADPAAPATAAKKVVHPEDPNDPRPKQDDFTDFDEYVDARSSWNARQVIKAENARQAEAAVETQTRTHAQTFMGEVGEYAKEHPGFMGTEEEPGAFETVRDELEDGLQGVSSAIVEHEQRVELINYLGTHPDAFAKILAHRGNPAKALMELGRVIATEFETPAAPVAQPVTRKSPPKPPTPVTGRGHVPSGEAALDAAAEANDFTAFQKTLRAREKAGRG